MPAPLHISGPCEICGQPAHGRHFGVISCRACAAFFRRAARINSKSQDIICEKGNCTATDTGIFYCKACRLQKCYGLGMDSSKFQNNRDLISSALQQYSKRLSPQSLSNFVGRPELILLCEPERASTSKFVLDLSFLIDKAVNLLEDPHAFPSPYQFENSLEKLTIASEQMKESNTSMEIQTKVGQLELFSFWEKTWVKVVKWFSQFPEFQALPISIKLDILKSTWLLWIRLEQHVNTANLRRKELLETDFYVSGEGKVMNMKNHDVDLSLFTNYSVDQIISLMKFDVDSTWKVTVETLMALDPTDMEVTFMLIQLCLNDAQKRFNNGTREVIEQILACQADNIHNYYTKKMKTTNYSGRLTRMMKVIQYIEADVRSQREKMHLAKVFDVFNIDFSHPEMFEFF